MSSDEAAKPSTTSKTPGFIMKGVIPPHLKGALGLKLCKLVKLIPTTLLESIKPTLDVSALSQLQAQPQGFAGNMIPSSSSSSSSVKKDTVAKEKTKAAIAREKKKAEEEEEQNETLNFSPPKLQLNSELQELVEYDDELDEYQDILTSYAEGQQEIIEKNTYMTANNLYTTHSRKNFYNFVENNYHKFRIAAKPIYTDPDKIEKEQKRKENACSLMDQSADTVQAFIYQKFIREYIRNASPYRGVLVYHGLGSGKTCSAIAAAEAIYGSTGKKIIVMTPFSLRGNFIGEISFCGFKHFSVNNYWTSVPMTDTMRMYAQSVLSISTEYMNALQKKADKDGDEAVIWVPDFDESESNYNDLPPH